VEGRKRRRWRIMAYVDRVYYLLISVSRGLRVSVLLSSRRTLSTKDLRTFSKTWLGRKSMKFGSQLQHVP
jgi:hypothetical protein